VNWHRVRKLRGRIRRGLRVREWPMHQKIAVGIWIPVALWAFISFTGPNGASGAPPPLQPNVTTSGIAAPVGVQASPGTMPSSAQILRSALAAAAARSVTSNAAAQQHSRRATQHRLQTSVAASIARRLRTAKVATAASLARQRAEFISKYRRILANPRKQG
jgi:hypothetical protein